MPKLDLEPCPVEVPIVATEIERLDAPMDSGIPPIYRGCGAIRDFSAWLTDEAIRERKRLDSGNQGAVKLHKLLRRKLGLKK
jgi:hypothetical protein